LLPYIIWNQIIGTKKKEFIEAVYFNGTKGFRSISETAKQANILSKPEGIRITQADVRRWKERENPRKKQLPGYNSFIVNGPYQEFQVDLLFFTEQGQPENKYKAEEIMEQESGPRRKKYVPAVICVDTFSKYAALEVLHRGKTAASVKDGLKSVFGDMGSFNRNLRPIKKKMPHTVYSDQEPALISNELQKDFFKKYNIRHLTTLAHAPVAERTIRTIKAIYEDMKLHRESVAEFTGIHWHGLLHRAVEA